MLTIPYRPVASLTPMATTRVRTHVVHGKQGTYTRKQHSRSTRGGGWQRTDPNGKPKPRPKPKHRLKPKRALRNAKRAYRAAKRNKGWTFLLWGSAASSEILAFSVFRGGGALLSVAGVGLGGLGTWMKRHAG
jgi:hypothetical protein